MTIQSVREFSARHFASATGLAALVAALDAKAGGSPLDPALEARISELLAALGAGEVLDGVSASEAKMLVPEIRHQLRCDAALMNGDTRSTSWSYSDPRVLQDFGDFARCHATGISKGIIPSIEGFATRFGAPGAAFLDIGVGVAGTAIGMAEQWPDLRIVGIDVWQPSLSLARVNVEKAGLRDRIELREQGAENLDDQAAFDLAWMPLPFLPERVIPAAIERTREALRSGGWLVVAFVNLEGHDPITAALWRLRVTSFGGPLWSSTEIESLMRDKGLVDVRTLPRTPGVPASFAIGRCKAKPETGR